ncbi:MAG: OmpA family protein [Burkholderiaceae bacterium]
MNFRLWGGARPNVQAVRILGVLAVTLLLGSVLGQSVNAQTTVFSGQTLTERSLINALVPRPAGIRTRSLDGGGGGSGSASVLITFRTNSDAITPEAQKELDIIAGALQNQQLTAYSFTIEGHADPRGPSDFNMNLSQRRAQSVVAYLARAKGVSLGRLHPVGKGETELMFPQRPAAPENRRVTIKTRVN